MEIIIFFILPIFVLNFYETYFYSTNTNIMDLKAFQRINNTYLIIYGDSYKQTKFGLVNATTFDTIDQGILFGDKIKHFIRLGNNVNVYIFSNYLITDIDKKKRVKFGGEYRDYQDQTYSRNYILIGTIYDNDIDRFDAELYLFKEPYNEISKIFTIDNIKNFKLIGLKDYFILIKIGEEESNTKNQVNYRYYILDLNLNILNSLTVKYSNYSEIKFSELSENNKVNEFIMCISYYKSITECTIIACKDSHLNFSSFYKIFSEHDTDNKIEEKIFHLYINIFDENKIGCYLLSDNNDYKYDYTTILNYNFSKLYYYKNINDIKFETIREYAKNYKKQIIKINNITGILSSSKNIHFIYFSTAYLENTISLNPDGKLNEFPIKEFIYPGFFSFYKIPEDLKYIKIQQK